MDFAAWATALIIVHLLGLALASRSMNDPDLPPSTETPTPSDPPDQGALPVTKTLLAVTAVAVAIVYAGGAIFDRMQADTYQAAALRCAMTDPDQALPQCEQFKTAAGQPAPTTETQNQE